MLYIWIGFSAHKRTCSILIHLAALGATGLRVVFSRLLFLNLLPGRRVAAWFCASSVKKLSNLAQNLNTDTSMQILHLRPTPSAARTKPWILTANHMTLATQPSGKCMDHEGTPYPITHGFPIVHKEILPRCSWFDSCSSTFVFRSLSPAPRLAQTCN
jgi:hypothetical protein